MAGQGLAWGAPGPKDLGLPNMNPENRQHSGTLTSLLPSLGRWGPSAPKHTPLPSPSPDSQRGPRVGSWLSATDLSQGSPQFKPSSLHSIGSSRHGFEARQDCAGARQTARRSQRSREPSRGPGLQRRRRSCGQGHRWTTTRLGDRAPQESRSSPPPTSGPTRGSRAVRLHIST